MSCLFNSLAPAVSLPFYMVRKAIVAYLNTNPKLYDDATFTDVISWISDGSADGAAINYLKDMSNDNTWGSAIEIKAFCELFDINVVVHVNGKTIEFKCSSQVRKTVHISYNGFHYEPLYVTL